jgi:hypothetical protein
MCYSELPGAVAKNRRLALFHGVTLLLVVLICCSGLSASSVSPVIVIGFVGGFVKHDNPVHSEVQLAARWGGAQAITLARELDKAGIPVLLSIQVETIRHCSGPANDPSPTKFLSFNMPIVTTLPVLDTTVSRTLPFWM